MKINKELYTQSKNTIVKLFRLLASIDKSNLIDKDELIGVQVSKLLWKWTTCEGRPGLKRFKDQANFSVRCILGANSPKLESKLNKTMIDCIVRSRKSRYCKIYYLSVLNVHRLYVLKPLLDVGTIEAPFSGS